MKSDSEAVLFYASTYLQRLTQQLLPPPSVTIGSPHIITTRVTYLDRCLQSTFNNEGRLIEFINRTHIKKHENEVYKMFSNTIFWIVF